MKRILIDMTHITPDKLYASLSIYIFRILDAIPVTEEEKTSFYLFHLNWKISLSNDTRTTPIFFFLQAENTIQQ